jgi:hypothetical protein
MWLQASVAATFVVITPFALYSLYKEMTHPVHEHGHTYSHMRIRRKSFPWASTPSSRLFLLRRSR